jgi:seryl-tRNA synthetase
MLDLRAIRDDPTPAREALARRGAADALDELLELDSRRRELLPSVEGRRAAQNEASGEIAAKKRAGEDAGEVIERMRNVAGELKELQAELTEVEERRDALAATLPNLPHPDAPDGGEADAVTLREVGQPPDFGF